jgi:glycine/D-amino acid oxidase-like deaminating enzyme
MYQYIKKRSHIKWQFKLCYFYTMIANRSYWETASFFNYDVVIIGSGIVGLNAAIHLKKSSPLLRIAILENGFLPSGASTKNAGFACFGSISELIEQEHICGENGLAEMIERRWKGLSKMRALLGDRIIDYLALGGHEVFKNDEVELTQQCVSKIEHYNQLITTIIGPNAFSLANQKIEHFGLKGIETLIFNQYEAQIDTGKMMSALINLAQQLGISIFNRCAVNAFENDTNKISVLTTEGRFTCKQLIIATNAFANDLIPNLDLTPGRGQVLITKPIKNLKLKGTFHYDKGYYYFRNINERILLGGGRNLNFKGEETTAFGETDQIQSSLENLLKTVILPDTPFEIDQRWSGIMAFGKQLEPIITEIKPNVFCAIRCNGMGVAMGTQTGEDVAELVLKGF